jgi:hypothetical protein
VANALDAANATTAMTATTERSFFIANDLLYRFPPTLQIDATIVERGAESVFQVWDRNWKASPGPAGRRRGILRGKCFRHNVL